MDSCSTILKANAPVVQAGKGVSADGRHGYWGERIRGSLNNRFWGVKLTKSLRNENEGRKTAAIVYSLLTTDVNKEALTFQAPVFIEPKADPKNVASIILGGGAGTRLFPLTSRRAKPAVPIGGCYRLIEISYE